MYKGPAEAAEFCLRLREQDLTGVDVVVCPPHVSLAVSVQLLAGTEVAVAAQNVHWEQEGAYTGEISAGMLLELGVYGAIVGHSERRQYFGETDLSTARRTQAALEAGLGVIACVGETLEVRESGDTDETTAQRARAALSAGLFVIACVGETEEEREGGVTEDVLRRQVSLFEPDDNLVIAYEPVWAIGTGKTATPDMAQEAHAFIKSVLDVPVIYGGSVKPDNAEELLGRPDVDGALVGGASLELESFMTICRAGASTNS